EAFDRRKGEAKIGCGAYSEAGQHDEQVTQALHQLPRGERFGRPVIASRRGNAKAHVLLVCCRGFEPADGSEFAASRTLCLPCSATIARRAQNEDECLNAPTCRNATGSRPQAVADRERN